MTTVEIPQSLIDEVRRRGVDIVEVLANILSLDPPTTSKAHLELAIKYLGEGRDLIDKDPIQSSEKLYKAAEESIKAIATALNLDESKRAREAGRWSSTLLFDAVYDASERLGRADLRLLWGSAWFLHVEGFHEARLRSDQVRRHLPDVEAIVDLAKRVVLG